MAGRIITKVGDVYAFNEGSVTYRLQLIAIDPVAMNSDVIAVFKFDEALGEDGSIATAPLFYLHTTVKQGVREGLWKKVGKQSVSVDMRKLSFKLYRNQDFIDTISEIKKRDPQAAINLAFDKPYWDVWTLGDDCFKSVGYEQGLKYKAERGSVQPAASVLARINDREDVSENVWPK